MEIHFTRKLQLLKSNVVGTFSHSLTVQQSLLLVLTSCFVSLFALFLNFSLQGISEKVRVSPEFQHQQSDKSACNRKFPKIL